MLKQKVPSLATCCQAIWFDEGRGIITLGGEHLPLFLWNVIPSHYWPLLTPPLQDPPLPQHYTNLCCAPNRCPNNSLSGGGGGGKLGLWRENNAAIFMSEPNYHTAEDLLLGGGRGFRHRFQLFRFPGLLKKKIVMKRDRRG